MCVQFREYYSCRASHVPLLRVLYYDARTTAQSDLQLSRTINLTAMSRKRSINVHEITNVSV